jgi:hypothetical protein
LDYIHRNFFEHDLEHSFLVHRLSLTYLLVLTLLLFLWGIYTSKLKEIYNLVLTNIFSTIYFIPLLHNFNELLGSKINILERGPSCTYTLTKIFHISTYIYVHMYMYIYIYMYTYIMYLSIRFQNLAAILLFYWNQNDSWRNVSPVLHYVILYFQKYNHKTLHIFPIFFTRYTPRDLKANCDNFGS